MLRLIFLRRGPGLQAELRPAALRSWFSATTVGGGVKQTCRKEKGNAHAKSHCKKDTGVAEFHTCGPCWQGIFNRQRAGSADGGLSKHAARLHAQDGQGHLQLVDGLPQFGVFPDLFLQSLQQSMSPRQMFGSLLTPGFVFRLHEAHLCLNCRPTEPERSMVRFRHRWRQFVGGITGLFLGWRHVRQQRLGEVLPCSPHQFSVCVWHHPRV